ncbi:MAG: PDDEXK nuclease domain-containing protein [Candidatus Desantisbacteria bacterium]
MKLVEPSMKGFTASNIWRMKQFYESYKDVEKLAPLVRELSWTNNLIIFSRCKTIEEREFYIHLCLREKYSKRELERQINTSVFERTMLADKKLSPAMRKLPQNAAGVFRDSYIFEFLDIPRRHCENDLQKAIIRHLRDFILEIGRDFSFVGEEYRLQVGNRDFFIDLLFYHRELQSLVAIELKVDEFQPEFMGQLNFYLEALDRDVRKPHENPSIGILLCKGKDDEVVEYALSRSVSPTLVADYETKLIPKNLLCQKLHEFYELAEVVANDD